MNKQKKIGIAILAALTIGVAGYFGYQHFSPVLGGQEVNTATAVEKIGVLESMRAVRAHPQYAQIEALEREMEQIRLEVQSKMERGMTMSLPSGLRMEISNQMVAGEQALRTEANQKLAAKETELNKRLAEVETAKRQTLGKEMETYRKQVSEEYKIQIFNIKMKLEALEVSDEKRASMEADLKKLMQEEDNKLEAKYQSMMKQLTAEMKGEQEVAHKEMEAYYQQIGKEYGLLTAAKSGRPNDEMMAKLGEMNRQLEQEIKAGEEAYAEKQREKDEIQNMIIQDIKMKVADLAREQGLTIVLSDVKANINAVDITDAVIEACKAQGQQ